MTRRKPRIDLTRAMALTALAVAFGCVVAIFVFLANGSALALRSEGVDFFTGNRWSYRSVAFEAAAMIYGSGVVALIAITLAAPIAILTALFISEVCKERLRTALKVFVEMLAGVPSVVYGLLGVLFLRSWVLSAFERLELDAYSGDTLLTAGILLAVMILPTLTTLSEDAFRSVSAAHRDAARGLGMTRAETTFHVVLKQAIPGVMAALLLALGRALGETIAVFLVVGRADNRFPAPGAIVGSLLEAGQTITSKLGGAEPNIAVGDSLHMSALLTLALVLFSVVVGLTLVAELLRTRWTRGVA